MTAARLQFHDRMALVKDRLPVSDAAARLNLGARRKGREWQACCPFHNERTPSFTIVDAKGFGHCFGCGWHGDVLDLVGQVLGLSRMTALETVEAWVGLSELSRENKAAVEAARKEAERRRARAAREDQDKGRRQRQRAIGIWRRSLPILGSGGEGSPALTYLAVRLGLLPQGSFPGAFDEPGRMRAAVEAFAEVLGTDSAGSFPTLRFNPAVEFYADAGRRLGQGPAMVAAIQAPGSAETAGGGVMAVHVTWLADGREGVVGAQVDRHGRRVWLDPERDPADPRARLPKKKIIAGYAGGAIRLTAGAARMTVAEGIETSLACLCALRLAGDRESGVWCGASLNNIAGPGLSQENGGTPRHVNPSRPVGRDGKINWLPSTAPALKGLAVWLPEACTEVTLAEDNDGKDPDAMTATYARAANRLLAQGRAVRRRRPARGQDFCDAFRASREGVGQQLEEREEAA